MRRVILQMGISLDCIVAGGPKGGADPAAPEHKDVKAWKLESLRQVGTHVMGRVTYEGMAAHWPSSNDEYAAFMNDLPKVVFSKSLPAAEWAHTRIARGDIAEEIARLRNEPGKDIMAHGGASFVQALSRQGLIDEYRLVIQPVALGSGEPLFKDLAAPLQLALIEAKTFPAGTVIHVYRPANN
jgi:dihydrofolate reductase